MQLRQLGNSGLRVSAVGLGSWTTFGGSVEETTARECIARAYDLGITFFDTANVYSRGRAEEVMGRALAAHPRDSFVLATKVYFPVGPGPYDHGLSRKHISEQIHVSLHRLGTDYIDLYQCHRYDSETPLEETCRAMDDLIRRGDILYWGVSEWSAEQIRRCVEICRAAGYAAPISNQPQYSAIYRRIEDSVIPTCEELGVGQVVWSPLAMGILTGKYHDIRNVPAGTRAAGEASGFMSEYFTQQVLDAVQTLRPVADDAGCTLAQLALAWCLRQPNVSSVIAGASRPEQVDENAAAAELQLDAAVLARVDSILGAVAVG